jgi:hypothetical protein
MRRWVAEVCDSSQDVEIKDHAHLVTKAEVMLYNNAIKPSKSSRSPAEAWRQLKYPRADF